MINSDNIVTAVYQFIRMTATVMLREFIIRRFRRFSLIWELGTAKHAKYAKRESFGVEVR
jgi:hypothetical protein